MMKKRQQIIEVVPYNPGWRDQFLNELITLLPIFGENCISAHHIGSTAIPGMSAKPTIDMMLEVENIAQVDRLNDKMEKLGYEAWGEYGIEGRRFFVKGDEKRTHHLHVFESSSGEIDRHLYFRDYLIHHPEEAQAYANLKLTLAKQFRENRRAYVEGKQDYVKALQKKAVAWAKRSAATK